MGEKHALPRALHTDGVRWVAVDAARNQSYTVNWSGTAANSLSQALVDSVPTRPWSRESAATVPARPGFVCSVLPQRLW